MWKFYEQHQYKMLSPYINKGEKILDFGCGDLALAFLISKKIRGIHIVGMDVVRPINKPSRVQFILYNGNKLPFNDNSFDLIYAYHVLHHIKKPYEALAECLRVSAKRVILVESIVRSLIELPGLITMDYLANIGRKEKIPMPFTFLRKKILLEFLLNNGWKIESEKEAGFFPKFLPIGKTTLFVLKKSMLK